MRLRSPFVAAALCVACASPGTAPAAETRAFVLTSDFTSGCLSTVDLSTLGLADCVNSVHADARARFANGQLYVVNRFGADNVQIVNPATGGTVRQFSVGNGSNPADIAWIDTHKVYVSRYASTTLWIGDPETGLSTGSIDLAAFADVDGIPEMDHLAKVGVYVFVALQRLDQNNGFQPTDSSLVAVIDSRTDTLVDCDPALPGIQAILLPRTNPYTDFQFDRARGRLLVGCVGRFGVADGGVVAIDVAALRATGTVITEAALGGDVNDLIWRDPERSFAVVADAVFDLRLVAWSEAAGVLGTIYAPGGFSIADVERDDRDRLWVCDNSFALPGLRLFRAADGSPIGTPIVTALPPLAVVFDSTLAPVTAAGDPAPPVLALGSPQPNPAGQSVALAVSLAQSGSVGVEVLDLAGRRVFSQALSDRPAGAWTWRWDLRDAWNRPVSAGIYLMRFTAGGRGVTRRVIVAR